MGTFQVSAILDRFWTTFWCPFGPATVIYHGHFSVLDRYPAKNVLSMSLRQVWSSPGTEV